MKWKEFIELFRKEMLKELSAKTSWGRKELESVVDRVCVSVLAEALDKESKGKFAKKALADIDDDIEPFEVE